MMIHAANTLPTSWGDFEPKSSCHITTQLHYCHSESEPILYLNNVQLYLYNGQHKLQLIVSMPTNLTIEASNVLVQLQGLEYILCVAYISF